MEREYKMNAVKWQRLETLDEGLFVLFLLLFCNFEITSKVTCIHFIPMNTVFTYKTQKATTFRFQENI